jgi:N-methylhydantoinase A
VSYRVGVDIGGTFTDIVFTGEDGNVTAMKIASTPDDYSRAVLDGIMATIARLGISPSEVSEIGHGFTIATNAILEGKGAKTALITTKGFRDVLEFRRNRVPRLYDLYYEKPAALVPRNLRYEVTERVNSGGEVIIPLAIDDVNHVIDMLLKENVQSVAICLLHSYVNGDHERTISDVILKRAPNLVQTLSSDLLPIIKEYERTSSTVINSYIRPVVERYLARLTDGLAERGIKTPVGVMQSNGGLSTPATASLRPAFCIESGPAAGVIGAFHLAKHGNFGDVITLDMGGTTAKATIIEKNTVLKSQEYEVGAGLNVGHRLLRGAGHIVSVPAIDIAEVGAGGGSIARVDDAGSLRVGPQSAGADPGPACYSRNGQDAAVTDANALLGYINPAALLGGDFTLNVELAAKAIRKHVAEPLGLSDVEAAYGIHSLANSNMSRALKAVSSERGRDPRRFSLFAFGGGGPVHAIGLAEMLGMKKVIVPPHSGVFSALGLLFPEVEHHLVRTSLMTIDENAGPKFAALLAALQAEGDAVLAAEGFDQAQRELEAFVDVKYEGQGTGLTVPLQVVADQAQVLSALEKRFEEEHETTFGHVAQAKRQIVAVRVIARGLSRRSRMPAHLGQNAATGAAGRKRKAYFGKTHGWIETPILSRSDVKAKAAPGPLLIEEYDTTTVVPPGWTASLGDVGSIILMKT